MSDQLGGREAITLQNQVYEAKSSHGGATLPCGYIGADNKLYTDVEFREITGDEEDIMISRTLTSPEKVSRVLGNCLTRLGPYTDKTTLHRIGEELLSGDRVFSFIQLRRISLGDDLPVEEVCPSCKRASYYELNLADLEIKPMPEPTRRVYEVTLTGGRVAVLHPLNGHDEKRAAKINAPGDLATLNLLFHMDTLDGEPPTIEVVKSLPLRDRNKLRDQIDVMEGGVDTSVDITCAHCGHEFQAEANLTSRGFFSPSSVRKDLRKKFSTALNGSAAARTRT